MALRIPLSTYRLQFNHQFTFKEAIQLVSYFHTLGISDLYASPIMRANPLSLHGYDIVDHSQLNHEVGSEEELEVLIGALREHNMGFIFDLVPNHMCIIGSLNKWWEDVLENGPSSIYAHHFNIIWDPPKIELKNKILLPILSHQYGQSIENQEIAVEYQTGCFLIKHQEKSLPLSLQTWPLILKPTLSELSKALNESDENLLELQSILMALEHLATLEESHPDQSKIKNREKEIIKKRLSLLTERSSLIAEEIDKAVCLLNGEKGHPQSFDRLEELLNAQFYRLSYWRVTNDEINYKRFFDINDLATLSVENESVFLDIHNFVLEKIKKKMITGLRIDHVDGLFDPEAYLVRLQRACAEACCESFDVGRNFYVIVEKILGKQEELRTSWLAYGTTGYDYLNLLNGLFVVPENRMKIQQIYDHFIGRHDEMTHIIPVCKRLILSLSMSSELHILANQLEKVSEQHRWSRDFTLESLRIALKEVIACFSVYRTYVRMNDDFIREEDQKYIQSAILQAKRLNPASDPSVFDYIENVLLLRYPADLPEEQKILRKKFVMHFQQLTGPVAAKGIEDTAFYRTYPLSSLNEVGMDPTSFGTDVLIFHQKNRERLEKWPHTLLASSTHDTKRSEDVRARINVLSEQPESWKKALHHWRSLNQARKILLLDNREVPDSNEEFLLYQTLIGSWPLYPMDASARMNYIERIEKYLIKAMREAKINTSWINPNLSYEEATQEFIRQILNPVGDNLFLSNFEEFVQLYVKAGLLNSLVQTTLKLTTPGVPDFYQGMELWQFTLVDPDNRQKIDYSSRKDLLISINKEQNKAELLKHLMETPEDGRIKLYLTSQLLHLRLKYPILFQEGDYQGLEVTGPKSNHVIAFTRIKDNQKLIVAIGRFFTLLSSVSTIMSRGEEWNETIINIPSDLEGNYFNALTEQTCFVNNQKLICEEIFKQIPICVLVQLEN